MPEKSRIQICLQPILVGLFLIMAACSGGNPGASGDRAPAIDGEGTFSQSNAGSPRESGQIQTFEVLNLGEVPWASADKLRTLYDPICRHLSEQLGCKVVLNVAPDYGSLQKDLEENNIQLGVFNSGAYADALTTIPDKLRYLATIEWADGISYKGVIFTRKDSGIDTVPKMKGHTIAFTDSASSSGYRFPLSIFLEQGLDPERFFSGIYFVGTHDKVMESVYTKSVDIGATLSTDFYALPAEWLRELQVVKETPEIPNGALAASVSLPEPLFRRIQSVFARLDTTTRLRDGTPVLTEKPFPIEGFVIKDNSFYQGVIRISRIIAEYEALKSKPVTPGS